jgi:hypothetical protein
MPHNEHDYDCATQNEAESALDPVRNNMTERHLMLTHTLTAKRKPENHPISETTPEKRHSLSLVDAMRTKAEALRFRISTPHTHAAECQNIT